MSELLGNSVKILGKYPRLDVLLSIDILLKDTILNHLIDRLLSFGINIFILIF